MAINKTTPPQIENLVRPYKSPVLRHFGKLKEVTLGSDGATFDSHATLVVKKP